MVQEQSHRRWLHGMQGFWRWQGAGRQIWSCPATEGRGELTHFHMKHASFRLIAMALLVVTGCQHSVTIKSSNMKSMDNSRLQWCIEMIDSGKIRRGMDTNGLIAIFGERLGFFGPREAFTFLSGPPAGTPNDIQLPPLWRINFNIDDRGLVTDISITLPESK